MLSIRMQRKGRTGHAQFRVIVQDSRFHPTSGRVVAYVGNYDPHAKVAKLNGEKISKYLASGAQPSDRVAKLLTKEGIKLPDWFQASAPKKGVVKNADKRRSTRPEQPAEAPKAETAAEPVEPAEPTEEISPEQSPETPETPEAPVDEEPVDEPETSVEKAAEPTPQAEAEAEKIAEAEQPKTE